MNCDFYTEIAERYDLFHEEFGIHEAVITEFFQKLIEENKIKRVLDCSCGTGRDLVLFHHLKCSVIGSDISDSMLQRARLNLTALDIIVPLIKCDYRMLASRFDTPFDAVMCLQSSLLHMPDDEQALLALRSMREVLKDGGILVITQGMTDKQWRIKPRFIPVVNRKDFSRIFVIDYFEKKVKINLLDIFGGDAKGDFKVWSVDYPYILLKDDYERLITEAGFSACDFYGSYRFAPYDKETSDRLIIAARK